eukprot:636975-Rhodomonas_salina.3
MSRLNSTQAPGTHCPSAQHQTECIGRERTCREVRSICSESVLDLRWGGWAPGQVRIERREFEVWEDDAGRQCRTRRSWCVRGMGIGT